MKFFFSGFILLVSGFLFFVLFFLKVIVKNTAKTNTQKKNAFNFEFSKSKNKIFTKKCYF